MKSLKVAIAGVLALAVAMAAATPAQAGRTVKTKVSLDTFEASSLLLYGSLDARKAACEKNRKVRLIDPTGESDPIPAQFPDALNPQFFAFDLMPAAAESEVRVSARKAGKTKCGGAKEAVRIAPAADESATTAADDPGHSFSGTIDSTVPECERSREFEFVVDPPAPEPVIGTTTDAGTWGFVYDGTLPYSGSAHTEFSMAGAISEGDDGYELITCPGATSNTVSFNFE